MSTTIKLLSMQPKLRLLAMTLSVILFSFVTTSVFGQATVSTDKDDYAPGATVSITGSGFQPGETVTLQVTHVGDGDNDLSGAHAPWDVVADANGNITGSWLVPTDQDELGATLLLTADGKTSLRHAEVYFTDATVTITTANVLWSSLSIGSGDAVVIKNGGSLIVDVSNGVCASIRIADGNPSAGAGQLIFNANSQVTVGGTVTVGGSQGGNQYTGTITMTNGGTLICQGFIKSGTAIEVLTPGSGTIQLTASNTLLSDFTSYNNLIVSGGTTSLPATGSYSFKNITTNSGTTFSNASNRNISISGNLTNNGTFTSGTGTVTFNGTTNQSVSGNMPSFTTLTINNSGASGNKTVSFPNSTNVNTTNLNLLGGLIKVPASGTVSINSGGTITANGGDFAGPITNDVVEFLGNATITTTTPLNFYQVVRTNGTTDFGSNSTINWYLQLQGSSSIINNGPFYATNSTLRYGLSGGPTISRGAEWSSATAGTKGYPFNVAFETSPGTKLNMGSGNVGCGGNLTLRYGAKMTLGGSVTVMGNLTLDNSISAGIIDMGSVTSPLDIRGNVDLNGTLILSTAAGGDLYVGGNWSRTGTFTPNGRSVYFKGSGVQTVTAAGGESLPNVVVDKAAGTVSLPNNLTIANALVFQPTNTARIVTNSNQLILGSTGTITGASSTSYIDGKLTQSFTTAASKTFPIGKGGNYRPLSLNYTALTGTSTVTAEQFESGFGGTFPPGNAQLGTRYWTVTQSGGTSFTYDITLDGTGFSPTGAVEILKYNAPSTNTLLSTTGTVPNYTASGLTSFSDFALGQVTCAAPTANVNGQPTDQSITYGNNASFTFNTSTATYQWEVSTNSGASWTPITDGGVYSGATTSQLTLTLPPVSMNGYWYHCIASNCSPAQTTTSIVVTLSVAKANATVVVTGYNVTYDGNPHTATYTITGVNGETDATVGTVDVSATTHTNAGTYNGEAWSFTGAANYNNTSGTVSSSIGKRLATWTTNANSKTYGDADPVPLTTGSGSNFVAADGVSAAYSRVPGETVAGGPYHITASLSSAVANALNNYTITNAGNDFTINKRTLTVNATSRSKTYGQTLSDADYTGTFTGVAAGDNITVSRASTGDAAGATVAGNPYSILNTLADPGSKLANYNVSNTPGVLTINPAVVNTSVTIAPPGAIQYSDQVTLTATITGGAPLVIGGPQAAQSVTFKIGGQVMNTTAATLNPVGADLVATWTGSLLETTLAGSMMPQANKAVSATFNYPNANFTVNPNPATATLNVTKEDAAIDYTGDQILATATATTSTATVTLRANILDITATPGGDTYPGDIRKAKVKFVNRDSNTDISGWLPVTLVGSDTKIGTVSYPMTVNLGSNDYAFTTVGVIVGYDGYYTRDNADDNTVITVYKPSGDFITGGGHIITTQSVGAMKSDVGSKTNFGFNVKFNKKGTSLQGNLNIIFRRTESDGIQHVYQIKANAMQSLGVNATNIYRQTANYVSKTNITDITNPLAPISLGGNKMLYVNMIDNGEPGNKDSISFVLVDGANDPAILANIIYSSNWVSSKTQMKNLAGGNLVVHSGFNLGGNEQIVPNKSDLLLAPVNTPAKFDIKAYPNPAQSQFNIKLESSNTEDEISIIVYGVNGKPVESRQHLKPGQTLTLGGLYRPGVYILEMIQGNQRKQIKLVKIPD